jgi:hypothetical protein
VKSQKSKKSGNKILPRKKSNFAKIVVTENIHMFCLSAGYLLLDGSSLVMTIAQFSLLVNG